MLVSLDVYPKKPNGEITDVFTQAFYGGERSNIGFCFRKKVDANKHVDYISKKVGFLKCYNMIKMAGVSTPIVFV